MGKIKTAIRPSVVSDAHYIAEHIRPEDAEEIWASTYSGAEETLLNGLHISEQAFTGFADEEPVCMWGVITDSLLLKEGVPWMLGTKRLNDRSTAIAFLRRCRAPLMEMLSNYDRLENYVDERNVRSIRWLKYLGFNIDDPEPYGVLKMPFHRFWMKKEI